MDDLLADALDEIEAEADDRAPPSCRNPRCWEVRTVEVLSDLGLSDWQIARYLHASESEVAALRRNS